MTEVDMLLRDTLTDRAEAAPNGSGLLTRVHTRSRLLRRRRRVGAAGAGIAAVLLGVAGVPVVTGLLPDGGGGEGVGGPAATKPAGTPDSTTGRAQEAPPSGAPTSPPPAPFTAVLGPPDLTLPAVPFTPPTGVVEGLAPPVAQYNGKPMIMHSHTGESDGKPLLILFIDATPDGFAQGTATPVTVRGVSGTLTRPVDRAHPGTILSWTEPDGTRMVISAGNIPDDKVIAYANGLVRKALPVLTPFSFTLLPKGLTLDNVSSADMFFKMPGQASSEDFTYKLGFSLNADGGGEAVDWKLKVGGRRATMSLQDDGGGRILMILQASGYVLAVQVPANLTISDEDLFRMAEGVTVNASARPGRG
jgi:hypothetical protein